MNQKALQKKVKNSLISNIGVSVYENKIERTITVDMFIFKQCCTFKINKNVFNNTDIETIVSGIVLDIKNNISLNQIETVYKIDKRFPFIHKVKGAIKK